MAPKKRPGKLTGLPRGSKEKPVEWESGSFYEGFAVASKPGEGKKNFPAPSRYWKRYKFERKSLSVSSLDIKNQVAEGLKIGN